MSDLSARLRLSEFVDGGNRARRLGADLPLPSHFAVDSRDVVPGGAFLALRGNRVDGHTFIPEAIGRGASLILAEPDRLPPSLSEEELIRRGIGILLAPDSERLAVDLARRHLARIRPRDLLGITGSVGKTTVRELTARALAAGGLKVSASPKSFNTRVGCALSVLMAPEDTDVLVLEYGANHPGEIADTVSLFPPSVATITEIAPAHLLGFGSIRGVLEAKMEILGGAVRAVSYNADNEPLSRALAELDRPFERIGVGRRCGECRIGTVSSDFDVLGPLLRVELEDRGRRVHLGGRFFGAHHAYSLALAWAAARIIGAPPEAIQEALSSAEARSGRGRALRSGRGGWVLDDAYNSNPRSLTAALGALAGLPEAAPSRRIAVLGGMRELGDDSPSFHRQVLEGCTGMSSVHLLGEEWRGSAEDLPRGVRLHENFDELAEAVSSEDGENAIFLIKGSRFYELERLVVRLSREETPR
jgi:UDP-N-acetylmuramoyl-tripeptide--D-alanyl-D-alanine ligase